MREIEPDYTKKTFAEAERVQNQITGGLSNDINVEFQYQGSVPLNTHIRLHSDLDILTVHLRFYDLEPPQKPTNPYNGDPVADLRNLRSNIYQTLSRAFYAADVKNDAAKAISISGGSLARKFDIIVSNWYDTIAYSQDYWKSHDKRAIQIYDKKKDSRFIDFPFTHMARVEEKNRQSKGENYKRLIRLLKNLKADADQKINLSSFMITSVMYHLEDHKYLPDYRNSTALLVYASEHLEKVIGNEVYRKGLTSPNQREYLFAQDDAQKVAELRKLKKELDDTIEDLAKEISPGLRSLNESWGISNVKDFYAPLQNSYYNY